MILLSRNEEIILLVIWRYLCVIDKLTQKDYMSKTLSIYGMSNNISQTFDGHKTNLLPSFSNPF